VSPAWTTTPDTTSVYEVIPIGRTYVDQISATANSAIGTACWATAARTLTAATNITSTGTTTVPQTGDCYPIIDTEITTLVTEVGKIPKSDSTVSWNTTALAAINAEVDTALNTAIPVSNTVGSVNDVLLDQLAPQIVVIDGQQDRMLGLQQDNFAILSPVYSSGKMTSCTVKIYPTATDCTNDTNATGSWSVIATYDVNGNLATYKSTRVT
jgi:hypothetical protein